MAETTRLTWFVNALRFDGSVLPKILPRIALFVGLSLAMAATYKAGIWHDSENLKALTSNVACNLVLGLLLVFRTNTAYERYWNGRIAWGTLIITTRNLAREIQVAIATPTEKSKAEKKKALKRLVGFAVATKCFPTQRITLSISSKSC